MDHSNQNGRAKTERDVSPYSIEVFEHDDGKWGFIINIVAFKQPLVIASARWGSSDDAVAAAKEQYSRIRAVSRRRMLLKKSANNYNKGRKS